MKFYIRLLLSVTAIIVCGIILFISITFSYRGNSTNVLRVNDITQTVKEQWDNIEYFDYRKFSDEMIIFNSDEFIVYSRAGNVLKNVNSVEEAVNKGCLCLSVSDGSRLMGTVIIPDPDKMKYDMAKQKLIAAALIMALLFILAGAMYGSYVHRNIIEPFKKMERFAVNVAMGSLDEPVMLERNNMFGAFTESFDIMREELKRSRQIENELKQKEKEMIASLSHDLKTPITGIKLLCELLSVKVKDEYVLDKVSNIHQKSEQINILVSDLLSSALDDLGEMSVSCCDEQSDILHELVAEHDSRGLVREGEIPPCLIQVDRPRLSQVIGNIISNSYKYAGTAIDVSYKTNDGCLEMSIRDHGKGVPADEIDLITNKFYRGKSNSSGKDGSGLGLYIARELMDKMNGELICSCPSDGFCATLIIPLS
ncbi:MAG: HAMP domain-containing histidine kinase [Ruminococcus sp.]|uniref:HAMP domain-containing sensor histidine kinase n=1 Tax=Ruminococcus sp. TaxID=41978 RepID=UPI0025D38DC6|nr:HAMP domain-containing sensor histidine kinase [Ruminococcus sp.]MCR4794532.1 HAMP domain-containing histidine kinase [Ruminococcus sp.]